VRSLLLLLGLLVLLGAHPSAGAVERGQSAPAFTGTPLRQGDPVRLEDFLGQVVYLDFWASWCGPCRQSLPWMERLREEFGAAGLVIIAVNVDETPADAVRFLRRFNVGYPVIGDARGAIAALYDVRDMPSSYLIDRSGVVREVHRGFNRKDAARLRDVVAQLVAERP
jgi:thiol-disulfide isomerase/thioredoxin